jgi:cytoskeleton protein RodZ
MAQFGEALRKEREERGVTLEMIVEATKVSSRHLRSLEEDRFDLLPGGVFNKGIVRSYARAIGLEEEIWVSRFLEAYRESGQDKEDETGWTEFAENVSRSRTPSASREFRLRWAGVFMLMALLAVSGYLVWHYVSGRVSAASSIHPTPNTAASAVQRPVLGGS